MNSPVWQVSVALSVTACRIAVSGIRVRVDIMMHVRTYAGTRWSASAYTIYSAARRKRTYCMYCSATYMRARIRIIMYMYMHGIYTCACARTHEYLTAGYCAQAGAP